MLQYVDDDDLEGEEGIEKKPKKTRAKRGVKASATVSKQSDLISIFRILKFNIVVGFNVFKEIVGILF